MRPMDRSSQLLGRTYHPTLLVAMVALLGAVAEAEEVVQPPEDTDPSLPFKNMLPSSGTISLKPVYLYDDAGEDAADGVQAEQFFQEQLRSARKIYSQIGMELVPLPMIVERQLPGEFGTKEFCTQLGLLNAKDSASNVVLVLLAKEFAPSEGTPGSTIPPSWVGTTLPGVLVERSGIVLSRRRAASDTLGHELGHILLDYNQFYDSQEGDAAHTIGPLNLMYYMSNTRSPGKLSEVQPTGIRDTIDFRWLHGQNPVQGILIQNQVEALYSNPQNYKEQTDPALAPLAPNMRPNYVLRLDAPSMAYVSIWSGPYLVGQLDNYTAVSSGMNCDAEGPWGSSFDASLRETVTVLPTGTETQSELSLVIAPWARLLSDNQGKPLTEFCIDVTFGAAFKYPPPNYTPLASPGTIFGLENGDYLDIVLTPPGAYGWEKPLARRLWISRADLNATPELEDLSAHIVSSPWEEFVAWHVLVPIAEVHNARRLRVCYRVPARKLDDYPAPGGLPIPSP